MAHFGRQTRMGNPEKALIKASKKKLDSKIAYFGSDRARVDFTVEVTESIGRYESQRRDNLYAIVMPSCSGKTYMCEKYGFIDIDRCCWGTEHELLNGMRLQALVDDDWQYHNDIWLQWVNDTIDEMKITEPKIILCHSEIIALAIGALPLAGFMPDENLFETTAAKMGKDKDEAARIMLARANRAEFMSHTNIIMKTKRTYATYDQGEDLVLRTLVVNDLPCIAPYRTQTKWRSSYYADDCPDWVLNGDRSKLIVEDLLELFKRGSVPRICMDYFFRGVDIPVSFGFGVTSNDWARFFAKARAVKSVRQRLDTSVDPKILFPYVYSKNETRANLTMSRLIRGAGVYDDPALVDILSHHVGKPNNFVTAIVCFWKGIGHKLRTVSYIRELLCTSYYHWAELMKEFHALVRLSGYVVDVKLDEMERQNIMYLNTLLGKEVAEADFMKEIEDRTQEDPNPEHRSYNQDLGLWTVEQYNRDFSKALDEGYCRMSKRVPSSESFANFYKLRSSWATKGSTVYNGIDRELLKYTVDIVDEVGDIVKRMDLRHNKRSLFEMIHPVLEDKLPLELCNVTKIVTKLDECGLTKRALFPGSQLHYIVFAYVLMCAEQQGQVGNVRLNAPPDDDLTYFETKMCQIPRLLFDWANFNVHHSMNEMSEVVRRLGHVVPGGADYSDFCWVIADQMYHMQFIDPVGEKHRLTRGLFSGWRGTTFINTVLNFVYIRCAEESFIRVYKHEPFLYIDGGGDDLDAGLNQYKDGYKMLHIMRQMNFQGTKIKQMIDCKSEFFRNTISIEGCYASATRALSMFVNGKWEGSGDIPITQKVGAILDHVAKLVRRGLDPTFGATMSILTMSHWCKVNSGEGWIDLPAEVIHGGPEYNGLGVPDKAGMLWKLSERVPNPLVPETVGGVPGSLASMDYISILAKELESCGVGIADIGEAAREAAKDAFQVYEKLDFGPLADYRGRKVGEYCAVDMKRWDQDLLREFRSWATTIKYTSNMGRLERYRMLDKQMVFNGKPIGLLELNEILDLRINPKLIGLKFDPYYRRLMSEPLAKVVTEFVQYMVDTDSIGVGAAREWFRTLAVMCSIVFEYHM